MCSAPVMGALVALGAVGCGAEPPPAEFQPGAPPVVASVGPNPPLAPGVQSAASSPAAPLPPPATMNTQPEASRSFGPTTPFIGGTLLATRDGRFAVVAQPETDVVNVVDLESHEVRHLQLEARSLPSQVSEDEAGKAYVVLRGAGAVAMFEPAAAELTQVVVPVCAEPRGITYDSGSAAIVIACRSGQLVWLDATGTAVARSVEVGADLRDVVATSGGFWVSTFRSARALKLDLEGQLLAEPLLPVVTGEHGLGTFEPHVATRLLVAGDRVVMQHQRANVAPLTVAYYRVSERSPGVVQNTLSVIEDDAVQSAGLLPMGTAFDLAITRDGTHFAVLGLQAGYTQLIEGQLDTALSVSPSESVEASSVSLSATATALTYDASDRLLIQTSAPTRLVIMGEAEIDLPVAAEPSAGKRLFYTPTASGVACAHCHPEGDEDGVTWTFAVDGFRRTQSLMGRITATMPLHWRGERADMNKLLLDTFVSRMGGSLPADLDQQSLTDFLDGLGTLKPRAAFDATAQSGRDVFVRLGCEQCHSGPLLTDNLNHDVGTGGEYQTPSLVGVGYRAPLMHDGCAGSIAERFGPCGGNVAHGDFSAVSEQDMSALTAYLETL